MRKVVVLPQPPFWLHTAITRVRAGRAHALRDFLVFKMPRDEAPALKIDFVAGFFAAICILLQIVRAEMLLPLL